MIEKLLTVGGKIELRHYKDGKQEFVSPFEKVYISHLLEIREESRIRISMPIENKKLVLLEEGEQFELLFYTSKGVYQCIAQVAARYRTKQMVLAEMVFLSALEKNQRRQYYRLNCILDVTYWVEGRESQVSNGVVIDISGGGARFNSKDRHLPGTILKMKLDLPKVEVIPGGEIRAKVVSSTALLNKSQMVENRVEFLDMDGRIREEIVKFIFEEERKRRRRENGG